MQHASELAELQEPISGIVSTGMQRNGDCSTEYQHKSGRSIAVSWSYHQNQGHTSVETMGQSSKSLRGSVVSTRIQTGGDRAIYNGRGVSCGIPRKEDEAVLRKRNRERMAVT